MLASALPPVGAQGVFSYPPPLTPAANSPHPQEGRGAQGFQEHSQASGLRAGIFTRRRERQKGNLGDTLLSLVLFGGRLSILWDRTAFSSRPSPGTPLLSPLNPFPQLPPKASKAEMDPGKGCSE